MTGVITRIALRYVAGFLVAKGLLSATMGDVLTYDPDVSTALELGAGVCLGTVVEGFYMLARRFGWSR